MSGIKTVRFPVDWWIVERWRRGEHGFDALPWDYPIAAIDIRTYKMPCFVPDAAGRLAATRKDER